MKIEVLTAPATAPATATAPSPDLRKENRMKTEKAIQKRILQLLKNPYADFNIDEIITLEWVLGLTNNRSARRKEMMILLMDSNRNSIR